MLRIEKGFTQTELAELVGIKQPTIAGYESGECKPKFDVATKLAKIFDTTVEELYGGQTEESDTNADEKSETV